MYLGTYQALLAWTVAGRVLGGQVGGSRGLVEGEQVGGGAGGVGGGHHGGGDGVGGVLACSLVGG